MATTTTNFGWDIPQSTDLVKDGATAIAALGQDIDTALVDLKGGTTGQVLTKASNTDLDYTWVTDAGGDITGVTAGTGISGGGTSGTVTVTNSMATAITTAGDLIKGTGSGTFDRLGIGTTGQVLTVSSGAPAWATPATPASGMTLISTGSFSAVSSGDITGCFSGTYNAYHIEFSNFFASTGAPQVQIRYFSGTNTLYTDGMNGGVLRITHTGTSATGYGSYSSATAVIGIMGEEGNRPAGGFMNISANASGGCTATVQWKSHNNPNDQNNMGTYVGGFNTTNNTGITGIRVQTSSGTFSGTVRVYGLAN